MDMVIPLRISIVDKGANGYPFEIFDANTYINKNAGNTMTKEEHNTMEDAKFSIKEFLGLKKIFNETEINKAEETPEEPAEPATTGDDKVQELFDKIDQILEKQKNIHERLTALETAINKSEENNEEEAESEENKEEEEDDADTTENKETSINKSITQKPADIPQTEEPTSNFNTRTNRDALFRKIRR